MSTLWFDHATAKSSVKPRPDCLHVKALTNHDYGYRLRIGDFRILFNRDDTIKIVEIEEVKKRDERTY